MKLLLHERIDRQQGVDRMYAILALNSPGISRYQGVADTIVQLNQERQRSLMALSRPNWLEGRQRIWTTMKQSGSLAIC
jgi:hypothetical protein